MLNTVISNPDKPNLFENLTEQLLGYDLPRRNRVELNGFYTGQGLRSINRYGNRRQDSTADI